uniref:CSON000340 protein n=1 Tax=Culicoides sonorensis TaxID=179676 RepID=A0A336MFI4_CULSO
MDVISFKKIISLVLVFLIDSSKANENLRENGVLSLLLKGAHGQNETKCLRLLQEIDNGIQENAIWAFKMVDASGFPSSGFVWGNNFLLGSSEQCNLINNYNNESNFVLSPRYKHRHSPELINDKPPFPVNYRVIYAETNSKHQIDMQIYTKNILHFGVCVPVVCNDHELAQLLDTALNIAEIENNSSSFAEQESNLLNATVLYSKTLTLRHNFFNNSPVIILICVFVTHIIAAIVCTILDKNVTYMPKTLKAFSWRNKWSDLVNCDTKEHDHDLRVVHGIKTVSMLWIIMGHSTFFSMASINNLPMILPYMSKIMQQPIFTSPTAVDTFFSISAFLMSFLLFKHKRENPNFNLSIIKVIKMIIHRVLRFTPAYMVAVLLTLVISMILHDLSPYWMIEDNETNCKLYWWRNLLYINNLYPIKEMCMSWSWYLSVELQCFTVGILLMMIYYKNKALGLILSFLTFKFSLFVTSMKAIRANYALSLDVQYHTLDLLYTPFWTRIGAYVIGMLSGHYLAIQRTKNLLIPKWFYNLTIVLSQIGLAFVVHSQAYRQENHFIGPFIAGFGRIIWAWSICWTIIICSTGHLTQLNSLLTKNTMIILSRLTYSVYLLNPICILSIAMMMETPIHLAPTNTFITGIGFVVVIYMAAVNFKFLFEDPYVQLLKILFSGFKDKSTNSSDVVKIKSIDLKEIGELEKQNSESDTSENK